MRYLDLLLVALPLVYIFRVYYHVYYIDIDISILAYIYSYLLDLLLLVELALCLPCEEVVEGAATLLPLRLDTHTPHTQRDHTYKD